MNPRVPKALVVCLDGVRPDVLQSSRTPALDRLTEAGFLRTSLIYAPPVAETSTGPGVATMVTGVWPGKHNVTANVFHGHRLGQYPDCPAALLLCGGLAGPGHHGPWSP